MAAALVAFQAKIINETVFNSVILLMLITAVAGPLITSYTAARLIPINDSEEEYFALENRAEDSFRVVVPVYNPQTQSYLLELASLLAKGKGGDIIPLAIAKSQARLDSPQLDKAIERSQNLLNLAQKIAEDLGIIAKPELRIEYDIARGISHASREVNANFIGI